MPKRDLPPSCLMTRRQVAARLGHSIDWLNRHMPRLKQLGFPARDGVLGGWHHKAVERWLDQRAGVLDDGNVAAYEQAFIDRLHQLSA